MSAPAGAAFLDMGTLDVTPVGDDSAGWFTESVAPGHAVKESIRISNFGGTTKKLTLYATDAVSTSDEEGGTGFFAKSPAEKSDDIASWIRLPASEIMLGPGESRILSVNIVTPSNAGVGLHTGAVIVRENADTVHGKVAVEKGVRIYLTVTGPVIERTETVSATLAEKAEHVTLTVTDLNRGTVDFVGDYRLEMREIFGNGTIAASGSRRIKPSTSGTISLSVEKPSFGVHSIFASDGKTETYLGTVVYVPLWMLIAFLCAVVIVTRPSLKLSHVDFGEAFNFSKSNHFRHALVYFVAITLTAGSTLYLSTMDFGSAGAANSITSLPAHSYRMAVKWGNFRNLAIPDSYRKEWEGSLSFRDSTVSIVDYLHFEKSDKAEISSDNTTLFFKNVTGPDNDGLILDIESTGANIPEITYRDARTGEKYVFPVTSFIDAAVIYPSGLFATSFKTEPGPEHMMMALAEDLEATPEIEATPTPGARIPELENLFVEDLPATPEVLADFILDSNYVNRITTERKTSLVSTDPILIEALAATPEVLAEISASPDLNFIFVPDEMVKFPPQEFSFDETKVTVENLGAMIFVQNKGTPWNTYVGTTDFTSISGDSVIPAYALTIIPGDPIIIGGQDEAVIEPGNPRSFQGTADKSILVNVDPGTSSRQIFIMNPQLQVRIPPGTLPGHYRGTLTITSL